MRTANTFEESGGLPCDTSKSCSCSGKLSRQHTEYSNKCFLRKECISATRRTIRESKREFKRPSLSESDPSPDLWAALKRDYFYYVTICHLNVNFLKVNSYLLKYSKICRLYKSIQ